MNHLINENPLLVIVLTIIFVSGILLLMCHFFVLKLKKERPVPNDFFIAFERLNNDKLEHMYDEIALNDMLFKDKVNNLIGSLSIKFDNLFARYLICKMMKDAISANLIFPLMKAAFKNNFTLVLSKKMFENYRTGLIAQITDRHLSMENGVKEIKCTITEYYPLWREIGANVTAIADYFLTQVRFDSLSTYKANLEICYRYKKEFKDDDYRRPKVDIEIGKFQSYISDLERRQNVVLVIEDKRAVS